MPDSMLIAIATTLATKAAGTLFDLVKAKLSRRGSKEVATLDAAVAAGPDSAEVGQLAEVLDAAQQEDGEFAEQLREEWQKIISVQAGSGSVTQTITGTVTGNAVQARDIQGGITFN
ncbi:MAG TPA: hypothetical protein VG247_33580 [Pseudonocardiaceae bacterium]|jgi:hypothetical protein|nr:hypothetical protein [Pseudonocardiaceae bacterium]